MKVHIFFGKQASGKTTLRKQISDWLGLEKPEVIEGKVTQQQIWDWLTEYPHEVIFVEWQSDSYAHESLMPDILNHPNLTWYDCMGFDEKGAVKRSELPF